MKNDPFALWAPTAERVDLLLVDPAGGDDRRVAMERTAGASGDPRRAA